MNTTKQLIAMLLITIAALTGCGSAHAAAKPRPTSRLIQGLIQVESHGNDHALGDRHMKDKAYGPLQVRKPCVDDVNRRFGTKIRPEDLLGNRSLSVWVCQKYLEMYATHDRLGREPRDEDRARIWNGGPDGWKSKETLTYWFKVQKTFKS